MKNLSTMMENQDIQQKKDLEDIQKILEQKVREKTDDLIESRRALMNILEDAEGAKEEAEQERDKTLAIIENFPEGLLFFGKDDRLSSINPKVLSFFNVEKEKLIGKTIVEIGKISSLNPFVKILGKELNVIRQKELKVRDGLVLDISVILVIKGDEKIGTLCIIRDITREKVIEQSKTEFVSIAAHQLRTPLSAIKWTLRMILDGDLGALQKEQNELLAKTYISNERMIRLINDLLNVTRIEEGKFLFNVKKEDVISFVEEKIAQQKAIAERKGLKIELIKPKGKIPNIGIDREKISLAFQNLIDNAIHYTLKGKITISIKFLKDKNQILFSIRDTGIGIPTNQHNRVFSRFFRAINAVKTETEGTGLGLFIAKNIIKAHNGKIWFESQEGKGSVFYFTLPIG